MFSCGRGSRSNQAMERTCNFARIRARRLYKRSRVLIGVALVSFFTVLTAFADLPRHSINGVPDVGGGQKIERFLLLEVVHKHENEALAVDQSQLLVDKLQKLKVGRAKHKP